MENTNTTNVVQQTPITPAVETPIKKEKTSKKTFEELSNTSLNKLDNNELKILVKEFRTRAEAAEMKLKNITNASESAFKEANYFRDLAVKLRNRNTAALDFIKQQTAALHKTIELTERELNRDGN